MTGSTAPGSATLKHIEANSHPIHRATALLEQALHSPAHVAPAGNPAAPTHSTPPDADSAAAPKTRQELVDAARQLPSAYRIDVSALDPSRSAILEDEEDVAALRDYAVHKQLRGLVDAFHDRQRQASLIVAASVAGAILLTLCGLLLLFGSTSEAGPNKALGGDETGASLAMRANGPSTVTDAEIIKVQPGQKLTLGPLIPLQSARYVLLRGLPKDMTLSAGRPAGDGSWMVKGGDVAALTLVTAGDAGGDHSIEIYFLDSGHGPQARQQLTLRVDARPKVYAAGLDFGLSNFLVDAAKTLADSNATSTAAAETKPRRLAQPPHNLLHADIDAARRELTEQARSGHADAAYRLALTYDRDVLTLAGLENIEADIKTAQSWYERAAEAGHSDAARRLEAIKRRAGA